MAKISAISCILTFLLISSLNGQVAPDGQVDQEVKELARLKMRTDFGIPLLRLEFSNGVTGTFALDTGFDINIVDSEFAKQAELQVGAPKRELQPGGEIEMAVVPKFEFKLNDLRVEGLSAKAAPIAQLGSFIGLKLDGILGHPFIAKYVIHLKYEEGLAMIYPQEAKLDDGSWRGVSIRFVDNEVLVPFQIQQKGAKAFRSEIKLDTGSTSGLGFSLNFYEEAELEQSSGRHRSISGLGAGGTTEVREFVVDRVLFANQEYRSQLAGATMAEGGTERRTNAGTVGARFLAQQDLVLDYPHNRILLGPSYDESIGMPVDHSGIWVIEQEGNKVVFQVQGETPSERAGLQPGDIIESLNEVASSRLSLDRFVRELSAEPGTKLRLVINRQGDIIPVELTLEDLIQ